MSGKILLTCYIFRFLKRPQMKRKAEELELEEIEAILHERLVANPQKRIPFDFEKYQEKRIKRNNPNNDDEKKKDEGGMQ